MSPSAIRHILLSIMLVGGAVLAGYLPDHSIFRCALFSALPVLGWAMAWNIMKSPKM